jgi:RHS repeat-associated protein
VDQILAEEDVDGGTPELVKWTLTDHFNTVRDIARYDSETQSTTVVNHLVYDAYGNVTSETNSVVESLFLFTARPFDPDTRLQNNLNRWYDPSVGRWLSEDPVDDDLNLYRYCVNNPAILVDPLGLTHCPPTASEIRSGEAVSVRDLDGDGNADYRFPNELPGTGYTVYCYSGGGGMFYVTAPDKSFCHRCPYVGGQNNWSVCNKGKIYNGSVINPTTGEKTSYKYYCDLGKLTITVYNEKGIAIRKQTIDPCKDPADLPMPSEVPPFPGPR